jgi:hypothetical protein
MFGGSVLIFIGREVPEAVARRLKMPESIGKREGFYGERGKQQQRFLTR